MNGKSYKVLCSALDGNPHKSSYLPVYKVSCACRREQYVGLSFTQRHGANIWAACHLWETYSLPPCCTLYDTLHSNFPDFRHWDVNEWKNATYSYKQVAVCSITGSAHRCQHRWSRKNHLFPPSRLLQYKVINMSYLIGPFVSLLNCLYSANDHWSSSVSPGWGAVPPLTPSNTHFY